MVQCFVRDLSPILIWTTKLTQSSFPDVKPEFEFFLEAIGAMSVSHFLPRETISGPMWLLTNVGCWCTIPSWPFSADLGRSPSLLLSLLLSFVRNAHPILLCVYLSLPLFSVRIHYRILLSTDEPYNQRLGHRVWKALSRRRRDNARYVHMLPVYCHP